MGSRCRAVSRVLVATLLTLPLTFLVTSVEPASAAPAPDLDVTITDLSPSRLGDGDTVRMAGTVINRDDHVWADAQAYLVIPATPFTTRQQLDDAIEGGGAYTGERVVDLKSIDELGDLKPGVQTRFEVTVPYRKLGISGAEGVYPVGVQILGTDVDGTRGTTAIARATTFLPLVSGSRPEAVSAGVVWPFVMPIHREADGNYVDPNTLAALVSTGGRLRNQLDLAAATSARGSTVMVDPALLVGLDDLSHGRHLADGVSLTRARRDAAKLFLDDLVRLAHRDSAWVLGYDRPDVLAISRSSSAGELSAAVERATATTVAHFQLTGRRVAWPTEDGVTAPLLSAVRGTGEQPVLVQPSAVPGWERRNGSLIQYQARSGPVPLLVNDALDAGVPGLTTTTTLRQRILGEAALASLQRSADRSSRADAVAIIDPAWNPGGLSDNAPLDAVFDAPFVHGVSLEDLMNQPLTSYDGAVPSTAKAKPISEEQVATAAEAAGTTDLLAAIIPDSEDVEATHARDIAEVLGVRWRDMSGQGVAAARAAANRAARELSRITVDAPDAVTLSSSTGSFPVTITNNSQHPIRIALSIDSSNPSFSVPDSKSVDVAAGERHTLTVAVDMQRQSSGTLTARMVTSDGRTFGEPAVFNVRSSRVGAALWVAIGLAAAFVVVALARRFRGQPSHDDQQPSEPLGADPDD